MLINSSNALTDKQPSVCGKYLNLWYDCSVNYFICLNEQHILFFHKWYYRLKKVCYLTTNDRSIFQTFKLYHVKQKKCQNILTYIVVL